MTVLVAHDYGKDDFVVVPKEYDYRKLFSRDVVTTIEGAWVYVKLSEAGEGVMEFHTEDGDIVTVRFIGFDGDGASVPWTELMEYLQSVVGCTLTFWSKS